MKKDRRMSMPFTAADGTALDIRLPSIAAKRFLVCRDGLILGRVRKSGWDWIVTLADPRQHYASVALKTSAAGFEFLHQRMPISSNTRAGAASPAAGARGPNGGRPLDRGRPATHGNALPADCITSTSKER